MSQYIKVTVDAVIFAYSQKNGLSILLIKRKNDPFQGKWAMPGGFVENDENLDNAVARELEEETGIKINTLEQVHTFGEPGRDPRGRIISVSYFALVRSEQFKKLKAKTDAEEAGWFNIKNLPKLAFDHKKILNAAMDKLRDKARYQPIGNELLDEKFPFSDLEQLYSSIIRRPVDSQKLKNSLLSLDLLDELDEKSKGDQKAENLYSFNKKHYQKLLGSGICLKV